MLRSNPPSKQRICNYATFTFARPLVSPREVRIVSDDIRRHLHSGVGPGCNNQKCLRNLEVMQTLVFNGNLSTSRIGQSQAWRGGSQSGLSGQLCPSKGSFELLLRRNSISCIGHLSMQREAFWRIASHNKFDIHRKRGVVATVSLSKFVSLDAGILRKV